VCEIADQHQVPVKNIGNGDQFDLGPELSLKVLHPGFFEQHETDNPASLTVLLSFQGRRVLLTGDLEGEGLAKILSGKVTNPVDVLLTTHHGSLSQIPLTWINGLARSM
jgi:competence protein ComEC